MVYAFISALTVSNVLASESGVLMQSQAQSEATLAALGMDAQLTSVLHTAKGSGRVEKMRHSTAEMEEQYKGLLQNIVSSGSMNDPKTGTPWLPSKNFFDVVDKQFKQLIKELEDEHSDNQQIMDDAHAAVKKCNTERGTDFTKGGGVLAKQSASATARGTHKDCRVQEDKDIFSMESKCATFDSLATKCEENQDWYVQYQSSADLDVTAENTLQQVVTAAVACKGGVDTLTTCAKTCDGDQSAFVAAFCTYEKTLSDTCKKHNDCYKQETTFLDTSNKSVAELEIEQKTIYRMVGKVDCYIEKLLQAEVSMMPKQSDIQQCIDQVVDDSPLDIRYDPVVKEDACMQNSALGADLASPTHRPGKTAWYDKEMDGLKKHEKLNANVGCSHAL